VNVGNMEIAAVGYAMGMLLGAYPAAGGAINVLGSR